MNRQAVISPRKRSLAEERAWKTVEWRRKLRRFQKAEERIKRFPLGPQYKAGLHQPSPVWRLFPRQKLAFDFARCCKQDVHVFGCEVEGESENGQRKYLVTTYEQFWDMYSVLHPDMDGHFYEVIPEGATCHLYFDLEFSKVVNPGSDGPAMVHTLITLVCWFLKRKFNISCTVEQVLDLDSSTAEKFSRHLVFHLPGTAFQDNLHAGNFVHQMCEVLYSHMDQQRHLAGHAKVQQAVAEMDQQRHLVDDAEVQEARQVVPGLDQLFVKNKDGETGLFIDEGVYTKNRNFRLYKNTKVGRRAPLLLAPQCKYEPQQRNNVSWDKQVFLDSLVSNVRFCPNLRVLRCEDNKSVSSRVRTWSGEGNKSTARDRSSEEAAGQLSGYSSSPYPEVDAYMVLQACRGGVHGGIRQWVYFSQGEVLMYDIAHNRWCENVGRPHRSNHVMLVADLKRQVWYQKCHDPVCRAQNYKSPERPLPAGLLPAFILAEDDLWDSGIEEEALLSALEGIHAPVEKGSNPGSLIHPKKDSNPGSWAHPPVERELNPCPCAVDSLEPSDQELLEASCSVEMGTSRHTGECRYDDDYRKTITVVDNCEISDQDLLTATQCCHGNNPCCHGDNPSCNGSNPCCHGDNPCCHGDNPCCHGSHPCCHGDNPCCQGYRPRKIETAVDSHEVADNLLLKADCCHGNNSGTEERTIDENEISDAALLASSHCCHDDSVRKTKTPVDSCELSDEELLVAAQRCHGDASCK